MKAVVFQRSTGVFEIDEVQTPTPADGEVLVAVHAAGVNVMDWYLRRGFRLMPGRPQATRIGRDLSGIVEAVGRNVTRVKPGDQVFGVARGSFAEYVTTSETLVAKRPASVTLVQAAGVGVAGLTALQGLRDAGQLQRGEKVLINGASGGIGTFMVQIAKALGAEVTGVCGARNVEMVRSIGADHVIDYQRTDFTTGSERYDVILDIVASHSWRRRAAMLTPTGRYVFVGGPPLRGVGMLFLSLIAGRKLNSFVTRPRASDLDTLGELMRGGVVPVIDRTYPIDDAGKAIAYVAAGHTQGKVVIVIRQETP
jgi:NADPH:quinone reductase-like Zn-dependent oxidoreductase